MTSAVRRHPHLYEVNARILAARLSAKYGRRLTLATIPDEEWQALAGRGFDLVWLMGVWQRSPGARREALSNADLRRDYDRVLPGWNYRDVAGSPYAVYRYSLDPPLGEQGDLVKLKTTLNKHGLGLVLDFVPNHVALDHPWTGSYPNRFVQGTHSDVMSYPDWFFSPGGQTHVAHGRDPYFPPWTDTSQLNFFSGDLRQALTDELLRIAGVADGVRCDMAMLALNDVFQRVWGELLHDCPRPETEFWPEAIGRVKEQRPDFLFLAEAYWGREAGLQRLGFDYTYDKALYDLLRSAAPADIGAYLARQDIRHERSVHFVENHDEPRAVTVFGRERSMAAAVVAATIPGLRLFHDGQLAGRRIRLPVQLVREPEEPVDPEIKGFYDRLLKACHDPAFHDGKWALLESGPAWQGDESHRNLLAWCWRRSTQVKIVAVNLSGQESHCRLKLPMTGKQRSPLVLRDELTGTEYVRDRDEMHDPGLYVRLGPFQAHILDATGDN